jgi:hypothetical protein
MAAQIVLPAITINNNNFFIKSISCGSMPVQHIPSKMNILNFTAYWLMAVCVWRCQN